MRKLLDHQVAPDPLKKWLIYAPVIGGKTFAVVDYLCHHPSEKALAIGSNFQFAKLGRAVNLTARQSGIDIHLDFCNIEKLLLSLINKYDIIIFENIEEQFLPALDITLKLISSEKLICTTSKIKVVQHIIDTGTGFDISFSRSSFGNSYINPTDIKFQEFQAFKRV